jgi:hypothetical protein
MKKEVTIYTVKHLSEVLDLVLVGWKGSNSQKKFISSTPFSTASADPSSIKPSPY